MTWRTHLAGGIALLALLIPVAARVGQDAGILTVLAALGSLLPDLDARESRLKNLTLGLPLRPFLIPAILLHKTFGHRGLLHSLAGLGLTALLLGLPLALWLGILPALALLLGYGSHLLLDAMTKAGIPWLFPNPVRFHVLPAPLRVTTGSAAEDALTAVFAAFALLTLLAFLLGTPSSSHFQTPTL